MSSSRARIFVHSSQNVRTCVSHNVKQVFCTHTPHLHEHVGGALQPALASLPPAVPYRDISWLSGSAGGAAVESDGPPKESPSRYARPAARKVRPRVHWPAVDGGAARQSACTAADRAYLAAAAPRARDLVSSVAVYAGLKHEITHVELLPSSLLRSVSRVKVVVVAAATGAARDLTASPLASCSPQHIEETRQFANLQVGRVSTKIGRPTLPSTGNLGNLQALRAPGEPACLRPSGDVQALRAPGEPLMACLSLLLHLALAQRLGAGSSACVRVYNRGRSCTSGKPPAEPTTYAEAVAACAEIGRNEEGVPYLSAIRQPVRAKAACIRSTRLARALGAPRPLLLRQQPKISTALRHHRHRRHQSTGRRGTMSRCPRCTVICVPVRIAFPIPIPFPLFLPLSA